MNAPQEILIQNRGFKYGDAVFETLKVNGTKILYLEDHYFRLMASMRMIRMEIPMNFTMEFFESEILSAIQESGEGGPSYRVRFSVYRKDGGLYTPKTNDVEYVIDIKSLEHELYLFNETSYEIELFKDHYICPQILSTLKTNNSVINVIGSVFAEENNYQNCLLLNTDKRIVEALNANVFVVKDNHIKTPGLDDGCIKGVMRRQLIEMIKLIPDYTFEEAKVSPFELQKADEIFLTNVISGIQPVTKYRNKTYEHTISKDFLAKLNQKVRLG